MIVKKGNTYFQKKDRRGMDPILLRVIKVIDTGFASPTVCKVRWHVLGKNKVFTFIVMRHWDQMKQDGDYWCGEFETDETDWKLAVLITNIQYACQRHYFGAMAEAYFDNKLKDASVNVQRRQKTFEAFARLPEEFTVDDVMRCFQLKTNTAARARVFRLMKDSLVEKVAEFAENGTAKARYKKTGTVML